MNRFIKTAKGKHNYFYKVEKKGQLNGNSFDRNAITEKEPTIKLP